MNFNVVTLFPELVNGTLDHGVTGKALRAGRLALNCWNPRDYSTDKHRTVDDRPYGGGPGMVMQVEPLRAAIRAAKAAAPRKTPVIYVSPQGRPLDQTVVAELAAEPGLILVAGRYEGIDERLMPEMDREISIGDYVLSGGELAAAVIMDAVARLIPGVLGDEDSAAQDSHVSGLLDHPHYTRPEDVDGQTVPDVLLQGDHAAIARWRLQQALGRTWEKRPDLLALKDLNDEERQLLDTYIKQYRIN